MFNQEFITWILLLLLLLEPMTGYVAVNLVQYKANKCLVESYRKNVRQIGDRLLEGFLKQEIPWIYTSRQRIDKLSIFTKLCLSWTQISFKLKPTEAQNL